MSAAASWSRSTAVPQSDRRAHQRYPITLDVEYKLFDGTGVQRKGSGRSINISSRGVLLALPGPLPSLGSVQLSIKWPFLLEDSIALKLMMHGNIVRVEGDTIAVQVTGYEFRTTGHATA